MDILDDSKPTSVRKESRNLAMSPRLSNPILKMVDAKQAWFLCESLQPSRNAPELSVSKMALLARRLI